MVEMEVAHRDDVDRRRGRSRRPPARARSAGPRSRASSRVLSSTRSPMPVSTRTRPPASRRAGSSAPGGGGARRRSRRSTSLSHRTRGTGPNSAPASDRNVPAWIRATRVPPPRSAAQSTASFRAISAPDLVASRRARSASWPASKSRWNADAVGSDWPWYFEPSSGRAVRPLDRGSNLEEADLADPHAEVEGDRQVRDVRQLERQVALPARVDVARGRVDQQAEPAQGALALRAWPRGRSGSSTHSRVWPRTNSPGWRMNGSSSATVSSSVRSGCGARTSMYG